MPPLISPRRAKASEEWVEIARFVGLEGEIEADLCVTTLKGSGIPAMRLPTHDLFGTGGLALRQYAPIQVLVPPNREEDAKELLSDAAIDISPPDEAE
jgi:hypothetical protein